MVLSLVMAREVGKESFSFVYQPRQATRWSEDVGADPCTRRNHLEAAEIAGVLEEDSGVRLDVVDRDGPDRIAAA